MGQDVILKRVVEQEKQLKIRTKTTDTITVLVMVQHIKRLLLANAKLKVKLAEMIV